ncbi:MAG TPA: hypothetical protein VJL60_03460, partial [Gammaproteobacteria bacterium]|nr:hypothetical protein [Gammaproteobacteria bacterium]
MKLRNKTLVSISLIWIAFLILTFAGSYFFLTKSFLVVEKNDADHDLTRIDVAISTITNGNKTKPPLGTTIAGRYLSRNLIRKLEETTQLSLNLFLPTQIENNTAFKEAYQFAKEDSSGHFTHPINQKTLAGFTLLRDINGKPIGMIEMTIPRHIYLSGMDAVYFYLINFILLGIVFSLLMLWLLRILIIKRLEYLDRDVAKISKKEFLTDRVRVIGNDEISFVATQVNTLLDLIQTAH